MNCAKCSSIQLDNMILHAKKEKNKKTTFSLQNMQRVDCLGHLTPRQWGRTNAATWLGFRPMRKLGLDHVSRWKPTKWCNFQTVNFVISSLTHICNEKFMAEKTFCVQEVLLHLSLSVFLSFSPFRSLSLSQTRFLSHKWVLLCSSLKSESQHCSNKIIYSGHNFQP